MTVSNTDSPVKIYTGSATEYPIPFDYISDNDILVTLYNTETGVSTDQTKDVHYTISDETVIYSEAPGSVYNVVIRRVTPYTQEASFGPGEEPPLSTYESSFDKLTMLAQDLNERLERCIMFPDSYSGTVFELPNPTGNAGRLLRINEDGTGLDVLAVGESGQVTEVTDYCDTADLEKLHAASSTPTADTIAKFNEDGIMEGAELSMTGDAADEASAYEVTLDLGSVKEGDVVFLQGYSRVGWSSAPTSINLSIGYKSGTSYLKYFNEETTPLPLQYLTAPIIPTGTASYGAISGIGTVDRDGTLVVRAFVSSSGGTSLTYQTKIRAFFLKKQ